MSVGTWLLWFVLMVGEVLTSETFRAGGGPIALREEVLVTVVFTCATLLPLPAVGRVLYGMRFARWYRPVGALLVAAATSVALLTAGWGGLFFCPALVAWSTSLAIRREDPGYEWSDVGRALRECLTGAVLRVRRVAA